MAPTSHILGAGKKKMRNGHWIDDVVCVSPKGLVLMASPCGSWEVEELFKRQGLMGTG